MAVETNTDALNGHETRSRLSTSRMLDAAGELIAEGGYNLMTLASIGERAGYSRGLATMRFGSKAKVLDTLVDRIVTRWDDQVIGPRTVGRPGLDGVIVLHRSIRDQLASDARSISVLYALMFEALGPNKELRARFVDFHRQMRTRLATTIRRGSEDGSIAESVDPEREAELIVAGLRGVGYQWRLDPEHFDPVVALDYLISTVEARLSSGGGGAVAGF
jgi:AcrR family transcriptional regulator